MNKDRGDPLHSAEQRVPNGSPVPLITMGMTLYHVTWCPECALVRDKLTALGIPYEEVVVPDFRPFRKQVYEVSGQYYVPVLKDGDTVLTQTREILTYLDIHYAANSK